MDSGGFLESAKKYIQGFIQTHWMAVFIVLVILIVYVLGTMLGFFGKKKEGMRACVAGSASQLCKQGRDGPGEGLTGAAIAQGYDADPTAFCAAKATTTDDPYDYLRTSAAGLPSEGLTTYDPADQLDKNLAIAMQH